MKLRNKIQHYDWGSPWAIPDLLDIANPEEKPMAELWMGAHPKAPSEIPEKNITLIDYIAKDPETVLGKKVAEKFSSHLPFLFKVLAAGRILSIQAHPNKKQAEEGFERENRLGIPIDAPHRNYRDDNHKPELLCALTDFTGLRGFRSVDEIGRDWELLGLSEHFPAFTDLSDFFTKLMELGKEEKAGLIQKAIAFAERCEEERDEKRFVLLRKIALEYPLDVGALAPLYLNVVNLKPGEAMFLPAQMLHAYVQGTGIEIMANSDNVLRGGCTSKHIDVEELLKVLDFTAYPLEILDPGDSEDIEFHYRSPASEFSLSRIRLSADGRRAARGEYEEREESERREKAGSYQPSSQKAAEILLCTEGQFRLSSALDDLRIRKGESVFVPASSPVYSLSGNGEAYRARIP